MFFFPRPLLMMHAAFTFPYRIETQVKLSDLFWSRISARYAFCYVPIALAALNLNLRKLGRSPEREPVSCSTLQESFFPFSLANLSAMASNLQDFCSSKTWTFRPSKCAFFRRHLTQQPSIAPKSSTSSWMGVRES